MGKITFDNKIPAVGDDPAGWTPQMVISAADMNQVKTVINGVYKKYVANLNQAGTSAPTVTVLENDLGYTPNIGYGGVGGIAIALQGITAAKVALFLSSQTFSAKLLASSFSINGQIVTLRTYDLLNTPGLANDMLKDAIIEIRVYD